MKTLLKVSRINLLLFMLLTVSISCKKSNTVINPALSEEEKASLVYMLEEEKLARDVYTHLEDKWNEILFYNIKVSEEFHINAILKILTNYNLTYDILMTGKFQNNKIQELYNQFIKDGDVSIENAYTVGATIEELDIVDLRKHMKETKNLSIIDVYKRLESGSKNHLRAFVNALRNKGQVYTPKYLSQDEYNIIINEKE